MAWLRAQTKLLTKVQGQVLCLSVDVYLSPRKQEKLANNALGALQAWIQT